MPLTRRSFGLLLLASGASAKPGPALFPGRHWETAGPEVHGLDPAPLDELAVNLAGRGCVVKNGNVVKYWGSQSEVGDWLSSAKPVVSTLLFFAIREGLVRSVPKDRAMTFAHLANMVSGYARPEPPGAAWAYNDIAIQLYQQTLFDRVFEDGPASVAMHPKRLGFLQLEDGLVFRPANRRLSVSVRDFARIAWFWLHKGNWRGTQLLPRRFFDRYCRPHVPAGLPHTGKAETRDYLGLGTFGGGSDHFTDFGAGIYGYNWWFNRTGRLHPNSVTWPDAPRDTFMSIGFGGNCAVIIPSLNLVLACARGNWGKHEPGSAGAPANQHIRLLMRAHGIRSG
ncbi:MAG: hypothetical protein ACK5AZ_12265 [Bryobacteraceae bacterium]